MTTPPRTPTTLDHRVIPAMSNGYPRRPETCVNCGARIVPYRDGWVHLPAPRGSGDTDEPRTPTTDLWDYWRNQLTKRTVNPDLPWRDADVMVVIGNLVRAHEADPCPYCDPVHRWPCPTIPRCDAPGCEGEATCGWPSDAGYRRTCGPHMREYAKEPQP
jgi:hypothetical protein